MTMVREPKNLCQTYIKDGITAVYTCPDNKITQVTEIWIANRSSYAAHEITVFINGTEPHNVLMGGLALAPNETTVISDCKIVLSEGKVLAFSQDEGFDDVIVTAFGIEGAI